MVRSPASSRDCAVAGEKYRFAFYVFRYMLTEHMRFLVLAKGAKPQQRQSTVFRCGLAAWESHGRGCPWYGVGAVLGFPLSVSDVGRIPSSRRARQAAARRSAVVPLAFSAGTRSRLEANRVMSLWAFVPPSGAIHGDRWCGHRNDMRTSSGM